MSEAEEERKLREARRFAKGLFWNIKGDDTRSVATDCMNRTHCSSVCSNHDVCSLHDNCIAALWDTARSKMLLT